MEEIVLEQIKKSDNTIAYSFFSSKGLTDFFSEKAFEIQYAENIEEVPDAIAAIPFVCNVLPIIWLTNSVLRIKELDQAFYDCITKVRSGFEEMFPESIFAGQIQVENIIQCAISASGGSAIFFSGGLDAVHTLTRHLNEKPALLSIWGSDIRYDNVQGWDVVHKGIAEYSEKYGLDDVVIRSTFRLFDDEGKLTNVFGRQLKDGWWHGVKHGIGLLGHAAPYAFLHGLSTIYIASTNCPADGHVRCSSNPLTDNHVRFANAKVVHDGFECCRQDKVRDVVHYVKTSGDQLALHVCWESQSGSNCCRCEKCYRTIVGLIAENASPTEFGFDLEYDSLHNLQNCLVGRPEHYVSLQVYWTHIQKRIIENRKILRNHSNWPYIKWILKADFWHPETLTQQACTLHIRSWLSQFRFYQALHNWKEKL